MSTATEASVVEALCTRFSGVTPRAISKDPAVNAPPSLLRELAKALRDEYGYEILTCVSGVDWLGKTPRFGVYYHFHSIARSAYLCVYADCEGTEEAPVIPSLVSVYPSADWHERETFDMFGIRFDGHPDLRRILMWDAYPYHPLRKEFPLSGIETDLPVADIAEETKAKVIAAPEAGGPFRAQVGEPHMSEREPSALDQSWSEKRSKPKA